MTTTSHSKKGGKTPSKYQLLRRHILAGNTVTGKQAFLKFGLYRLSSAIHKMRAEGHPIRTIPVTEKGETFAKYKLAVAPMNYAP